MNPVKRTDEPSHLAHQKLVERAKAGGITHYFLGDSITRRWAAAEPEYADLRRHWDTFLAPLGAANFGWGGDTLENILWRIQNGELDNVHPETVFLMAGTNNLPGGDNASQIARKTHFLIREIRRRAPEAQIFLTPIFPRFDNPNFQKIINHVNLQTVLIPNITLINPLSQIANPDLFPDGLHPSLTVYEIWAHHIISAIETRSPFRRPLS